MARHEKDSLEKELVKEKKMELLGLLAEGATQVIEPVDLNAVVQDYLMSPEFCQLGEFHTEVIIKTDLEDDLPLINASGIHLKKAVMNLVSNAIEALNNKGNVFIKTHLIYLNEERIKGYEKVRDGNYIRLRIQDRVS
jgi:two-component system, cell cycle sensor histidine kinase and response regulator CckA